MLASEFLRLADALKFGALSAADFAKLATAAAGSALCDCISSPLIDFLAAPANDYLIGQPLAGYYFWAQTTRVVIDQLDGTITTGPTGNAGNNVAKTNLFPNAIFITAGTLNTMNGLPVPAANSPAGVTNLINLTLIAGAQFKADITAAAVPNTATKCKGYIQVAGVFVKA